MPATDEIHPAADRPGVLSLAFELGCNSWKLTVTLARAWPLGSRPERPAWTTGRPPLSPGDQGHETGRW